MTTPSPAAIDHDRVDYGFDGIEGDHRQTVWVSHNETQKRWQVVQPEVDGECEWWKAAALGKALLAAAMKARELNGD